MMRVPVLIILATTCIGAFSGCKLQRALTTCRSSTDCDTGNVCSAGTCVANAGCEVFPPPSCSMPVGADHPTEWADFLRLLRGRWLFCSGSPVTPFVPPFMMPPPVVPPVVGFEFSDDTATWSFLIDDGAGRPVPLHGPRYDGVLELIVEPGSSGGGTFKQLFMTDELGEMLTLQPHFADGPPLRMGLHIGDPMETIYVHDDTGCGDVASAPTDLGMAPVDDGGTTFGQSCPTATQTAMTCPPVNGVYCSICPGGFCAQPCHMNGSECPTPQQCVPMAMYGVVLSGACADYDGYCK